MIKDINDAVSERIKAPIYGYVILAFVAINWKGFFFLIMTTGAPALRWAEFESHTSFWSLYVWPVLFGLALTLISPWTRYVFDLLSKKPLNESNNIFIKSGLNAEQAKTDYQKILIDKKENEQREIINKAIMKNNLEKINMERDMAKEQEIFNRTIMDIDINNADIDEKYKDELMRKIHVIRSGDKDFLFNMISNLNLSHSDMEVATGLYHGPLTINLRDGIISNEYLGNLFKDVGKTKSNNKNSLKFESIFNSLNFLLKSSLANVKKTENDFERYELTNEGKEIIERLATINSYKTLEEELHKLLKSNERS